MKKYLFSIIFLLVSYVGFSQKGLSYQAVILDPNKIEVPGQDITGQPLVNGDVWMKFSIYNGSSLQFEEVQKTKTDNYGLVNLIIGSVSTASFNSLVWDSSQKTLQVHVSFVQGSSYTKVSDQKLTYSPYTLFAETAGKLGGVLGIAGGGTGATTAADARLNLGLDQVNNTSDAAKPVSAATRAALDLKANVSEMAASLGAKADTANVKTALALKANTADVTTALAAKADTAYVLNKVSAATIADADTSTKGKIQLAGDLGGTAAAPTVPGLALKANTADVTAALALKANSSDVNSALAAKVDSAFVLAKVVAATIADADASTKGKIQLAGDLGGTAAAPTVPGLALKANTADVTTSLDTKVDKVTGKDLSSNDYTTAEKDKLATIIGTNTGDQLNITGNAATATKLATAKNINGVAFDGSTDITVTADAGTLTGTTLASNVVNSNLTSVGTLTSGTISLTTDIVTSGNLKAGAITYPNTVGTDGQVLTSNGAGNASWISPKTVSVGTISSTSSANGATITSAVLNLTPADETNGGIITTGTQSFAGLKTFKDGINYIKVSSSSTLDQSNISSNGSAGGTSVWQSFTAGINGILSSVEWEMQGQLTANRSIAVNIYNGEGTSGTLLGTKNGQIPTTRSFVAFDLSGSNIKVMAGQIYTIQATTVFSGISRFNNSDVYVGGRSSVTANGDFVFKTYVKATSTDSYLPLSGGALTGDLSTSGTLTAGAVTYPNTNGTQGQVLIANTNGSASWGSAPSAGVPYTGATGAVNLGAYDLTVNGLTIGKGSGSINYKVPNTAIGFEALISNTQGTGNTSIGYKSLNKNTLGNGNSSFGESSLYSNLTGGFNSSFGSVSLYFNTEGTYNSSFGFQALFKNTTGSENTATGFYALPNNTLGNFNTAIGSNTLVNNTLGEENTANGVGSLYGNTEGDKNTAIGRGSLATNTLGNRNTAIGYNADVVNGDLENATAIGNGAIVAESNTMQLGNSSVTNVNTSGSITAGLVKIGQGGFVDSDQQYVGRDVGSTAVGYEALISNTDGYNNTAIGYTALKNNVMGGNNSAFGYEALVDNNVGSKNTAFGNEALKNNLDGSNNSAFGPEALSSNTSGQRNIAMGNATLKNNTIGSFNTVLGSSAAFYVTGNKNTAVGNDALSNQASGDGNTAIGHEAGSGSEYSTNGTFLGHKARQEYGKTLFNATAIGYDAEVTESYTIQLGNADVTNVKTDRAITVDGIRISRGGARHEWSTAIGYDALINNFGGFNNTAIGYTALKNNVNGIDNSAFGPEALLNNTDGVGNTAIGRGTLIQNSIGSQNTAVGNEALNIQTSGDANTAIGYRAGAGSENSSGGTFLGYEARQEYGKTLFNATAIGYDAEVTASNTIQLGNDYVTNVNTSGSITAGLVKIGQGGYVDSNLQYVGRDVGSTAVGFEALISNNGGINNTAIGYAALKSNVAGYNNSAFGDEALRDNSGYGNTAIGHATLVLNTSGANNTAVGTDAAYNNLTGIGNTAIGANASQNLSSGDFNTALGYYANVSNGLSNATAIGYQALVTETNSIQLGNADVVKVNTNGTVWSSGVQLSSDLRLKTNIQPLLNSIDLIMKLNPVHYNKKNSIESSDYAKTENGFIAQELQKVLPYLVSQGTDQDKILSVDYNSIIPVLTKGIQEQQVLIEAQQKQIDELKLLLEKLLNEKK